MALSAPLMASTAFGAPCVLTGYVVSPDLSTYSIPGLGLAAFDGIPASCVLTMPIQTGGADVISMFAGSYSGELTPDTGGRDGHS